MFVAFTQQYIQSNLTHVRGVESSSINTIRVVMLCVAAANSLTWMDHDLEAVTGEPSKLFQPVCVREESEWRPVGALVSVPV